MKKNNDLLENFYDFFQIGIELEGEFKKNPHNTVKKWEIGSDGSIRQYSGGTMNELRTGIISTKKAEADYIEDVGQLTNKTAFAFENNSCGTHIHFSFKKTKAGKNYSDQDLYVFDTIDFERYFFKMYEKTFKRDKFLNRLNNDFSKSTYAKLDSSTKKIVMHNGASSLSNSSGSGYTTQAMTPMTRSIHIKYNNSKYIWLNMSPVSRGQGAEIRIFPCITSKTGLRSVINFTKLVLMSYFQLQKTQSLVKDLRLFRRNIQLSRLEIDSVGEIEKILLLTLDAKRYIGGFTRVPGDIQRILAAVYKKNPKAFVPLKA